MNTKEQTNYDLFVSTVGTLAGSQGFYSRLQAQIDEWDDDKVEEVKEYFNTLPTKFHDTVDVIMFLEQ